MKINFHQLVSAVGSKKDKIAAGLLVLYAQAASAGDVQAFDKLYTQLTGWAQGSLGKSIAIIFLLIGMLRDWRVQGRVHPAWLWSIVALLAVLLLSRVFAFSPIGDGGCTPR